MFENEGKVTTMAIVSAPLPMSPRRRARLARTLFVASLGLLTIAGLVGSQAAVAISDSINVSNAYNYVSVLPGETLWELAQSYAEDRNPQDWIAEVMLLNNLSSANLVVGDRLALPNS